MRGERADGVEPQRDGDQRRERHDELARAQLLAPVPAADPRHAPGEDPARAGPRVLQLAALPHHVVDQRRHALGVAVAALADRPVAGRVDVQRLDIELGLVIAGLASRRRAVARCRGARRAGRSTARRRAQRRRRTRPGSWTVQRRTAAHSCGAGRSGRRCARSRSQPVSSAAGIGTPSRWPWASSQPHSARSVHACGAVDALGHDVQAEPPPQVDERVHDRGVALVLGEPHDERAVDLERVDLRAP